MSTAAARVSRIAVTDNGPGVPAGLRERVFQPFFTMKRNGTGLGLALVQKIIVFHNGRIAVARRRKVARAFRSRCRSPADERPQG